MPKINLGKPKERVITVNKKAYQAVYQHNRWRELRKYKFMYNPLCEDCLANGVTTQTEEIHHIIPFSVRPELAYDYDNLRSLCVSCHKEAHQLLGIKY